MKELIQKSIKLIFGDTRQAIISMLVFALVGGYSGLLYLSKTVLEISLLILNMQMPLWATSALIVLCCLYTYVRVVKNLSPLNQTDQSPKPLPHKIMSFTIDDLKWNTKIYDDGKFEVDRISICLEHDLTLIRDNIDYYCPEYLKKNCKIMIDHIEYDLRYVTAKSYIGKKIRNKKPTI